MKQEDLWEKTLSSEEIFNGVVVHLFRDKVLLPNGAQAVREVVRHPGAVCVVPLTEAEEVVMVRQFRYPFGRVLLEIPAGKLEKGEDDPAAAALRELSEETGAQAGRLESLGMLYSSVAIFDEQIYMYLARDLTFTEMHPDADEFLCTQRIPLKRLVEMILAGEICDAKTQTALLKTWYRLHGAERP